LARPSSGSSPFWLILILIGLGLCYAGVFYQTGAQFYDTCWKKAHANGREPDTPAQAAQWSACEETADAALFNAGFVFSGNREYAVTPLLKALVAACPSNYSDIPMVGTWDLAVKLIQDTGGPTLKDRFAPASSTIVRVFKSKWPNCVTTAAQNGIPKFVKRDGRWVLSGPCLPCEAEEQALAKHDQEVRERNSLSDEEKGKKALEELMRENAAPPAK
jgi:hypothetical protein